MPEAVWKGFLRLSLVSCPVTLSPATSEAQSIKLDQLNSRTGNPVTTQYVDSRTGDVVSSDAVVKGYSSGSGYITLSDDEIAELSSQPGNIIEVAHFASKDQIDRARHEASYYIYPDGALAPDTLEAVRLAMQRSGRDALAYVELDGREKLALIQVHGAGLMLSTLRPPSRLETAEFAERPEAAVPADQIELAQSIISRRTLDSDANALHDRYEDRLRSLIERKSGGAAATPQVASPPPPAPPPPPPPPEPEPVAVAPPPPPEPEPEPEPEPRHEPEGSVLAAEPKPPPAEPPPAAVEATERAAEAAAAAAQDIAAPAHEGSVTAGEPEITAAAAEPEPEPPPPEPEPEPEPAPIAAVPPPPPEPPPPPPPVEASPAVDSAPEARERAERSLFDAPPASPTPAAATQGRELGTEILLHIMGLGDRRFIEPGWAGSPGSRRQIEAMSVRPREELDPSAIEFRVFAQEGRATAWVSNGNYAGTRGRELPLTGFAVRPSPELRDRFDVSYEGCFFDGGVVGPRKNGEICTSPVTNDPLEAVRITIVEHT